MQDTELFLSLAEIAGVFVGFGTLIAIRGNGTSDVFEVTWIGTVVWVAIQVVVAALVPVVINRFGVTGHELWLVCSLVALALWWIGDEVVRRMSPERLAYQAARPIKVRWRQELAMAPLWVPANVALVVVVLGLLPAQESALYLAAVVLILFMDACLLLTMVASGARPRTAPGPAALPATPMDRAPNSTQRASADATTHLPRRGDGAHDDPRPPRRRDRRRPRAACVRGAPPVSGAGLAMRRASRGHGGAP